MVSGAPESRSGRATRNAIAAAAATAAAATQVGRTLRGASRGPANGSRPPGARRRLLVEGGVDAVGQALAAGGVLGGEEVADAGPGAVRSPRAQGRPELAGEPHLRGEAIPGRRVGRHRGGQLRPLGRVEGAVEVAVGEEVEPRALHVAGPSMQRRSESRTRHRVTRTQISVREKRSARLREGSPST